MAPAKKKGSPQKNTGRKRVIKEKKVLKKPTVIKIKIPSLQQKGPDPTSENPKKLSSQRKIELANEVAFAQLCKEAEIVESSSTPPTVKKTIRKPKKATELKETSKVKKSCVRKPRKQIPETIKTEAETNTTADIKEETPKKKATKKTTMPKTPKAKTLKPQAKSADITAPKKRGRPFKKNIADNRVTPQGSSLNKTRTLRSHNNDAEDGGTEDPTKVPTAQVIESRTNSATSNMSWTRDISTSSTTTCVTVSSNDVVRVDNRLPVLQLRPIGANLLHTAATTPSSSDSESESLSVSSKRDEEDNIIVDVVDDTRDLSELVPDLSLSDTSDEDNIYALLRQIKINQQNLDREIDKLCPETPSNDIENDFADILSVLTLESELLKQSRCLRNILEEEPSDDCPNQTKNSKSENSSSQPTSGRSYLNDNINENNENYTPFDEDTPEDEDALSLFAESFTDVESSRVNEEHDEYVPLPRKPPIETFTYRPTKITDCNENKDHNDAQTGLVSVVQNVTEPNTGNVQNNINAANGNAALMNNAALNAPRIASTYDRSRFIASVHKPLPGMKSSVFKGVCFFNLVSGCKNLRCRYRHEVPEAQEIERRLMNISEDSFIQEYILMRTWPELRRKYGLFFVYECDKRELTNVLVEMGIDFVTKANLSSREDADLRVKVLEVVLMHLNRAPLEVCADLLRYTVHYAPLYHTLMKTIADTQNFSRFKAVFVKLSRFIIEAGGSFDIDTVAKILERVCILPFDESLVRAMHSLIRNTDKKIYDNTLMKQFRVLLEQLDDGGGGDTLTLQKEPDAEQFPSTATSDNDHSVPIASPTIIRTVDLNRVKPNYSVLRKFRSNNVRRQFTRWGSAPRLPPPRTQRQVAYGTLPPLFMRRPNVPKF